VGMDTSIPPNLGRVTCFSENFRNKKYLLKKEVSGSGVLLIMLLKNHNPVYGEQDLCYGVLDHGLGEP
jgi:hypothetical protein